MYPILFIWFGLPRLLSLPRNNYYSERNIDALEEDLINEIYGDRVRSEWTTVPVRGELWNTHYIKSFSSSTESLPVMLLLHGYGGEYRSSLRRCNEEANIHILISVFIFM
jgi:hypothetical protein